MQSFIPPGFALQRIKTPLGTMAYYCSAVEDASSSTLAHPPILFLHGFGGGASAYEWSKVYPSFATTYKVIAPDLLGWGESQHPKRNYSPEDYLLTLKDFIQSVVNPPIAAIASSLTAAFVIRLAVDHPELFNSLFLVCPSGFRDFGHPAGRRIPLPLINTPPLDRAIYVLGATNECAVRSFLERFLFVEPARLSPETVAAYLVSAQQPNAEYAALSFLRGDLYFDLAEYIPGLKVATAIAWGDQAQFISPELGRRLADLNRNSIHQFHLVPGTGILPHLELPAVVTGLLEGWLRAQSEHPQDLLSLT